MSYSFYNLSARIFWYNRPLVARAAFDQIASYLRQLQALSPLFSRLHVSRYQDQATVLLGPDFSSFDAEVALAIPCERAYENADPADKAFSMSCMGCGGFGATFATVVDDRQAGCWIDVSCGSDNPEHPNCVDIKVSPELESPDFLRALLDNTILFWKPASGLVTRAAMHKVVRQPIGEVDVGWLTYLSNPDAVRALPASVSSYLLADGIVVQAAERPGHADDPEYVRSVLCVRDALEPHGFLRDPTEVTTVAT